VRKHLGVQGLKLVAEALSKRTWREDLGIGRRDAPDRWRTYLENGIPEYWLFNFGMTGEPCPLPARSALFLMRDPDGRAWLPMPIDDGEPVADVRGFTAVKAGRVRSVAVPGLVLDLASLWSQIPEPGASRA
jgi:hypothetical protein